MRRQLSLPIALAGGLLACDDALVQPAVPDHDAQRAALVAGESWEVFTVATSQDGYAYAAGINDSGVIVGYIDEGNVRAYRYSAGSMTTYLSPEGYISAQEINKSGQIVGSIRVTGTLRAYVRQADGSLDLLPYGGPAGSHNIGVAINDAGEVAGNSTGEDVPTLGLRWSVAIGGWIVSNLGIILNKPVQFVHDINNAGWIVGAVADNTFWHGARAFVHTPGGGGSLQLIGTLGGQSIAWSVNSSGKVVGSSELVTGAPRAFSWTSFGGMKNEGAIAHRGAPTAISDKGRFVAHERVNGRWRVFTVYNGVRTTLPLLPNARSSYLSDVNSCGAIVGYMAMNDGSTRAVRWRRVVGKPLFPVCD